MASDVEIRQDKRFDRQGSGSLLKLLCWWQVDVTWIMR